MISRNLYNYDFQGSLVVSSWSNLYTQIYLVVVWIWFWICAMDYSHIPEGKRLPRQAPAGGWASLITYDNLNRADDWAKNIRKLDT